LYDVTFNIPLIIFGKGIPKNKKINTLTQLEDLTPTIFNLLNLKYSPDLFDGQSLLPLILGKKDKIRESIFMEEHACGLERRGVRTLTHRYSESLNKQYSICELCNTGHGPKIALYDLEKNPEETINILEDNKELAKEMKQRLNKKIKDLRTINEKRRIQKLINNLK
jgi:arylsulfatase A-like enzyme